MSKKNKSGIEAYEREFAKRALSTVMNDYQQRLYNENKDIAEWLAFRVSCRGVEPEMLIPAAETLLKKAVINYDETKHGDFELFATVYVESRLIQYRESPADLDYLIVSEEHEKEFRKMVIN